MTELDLQRLLRMIEEAVGSENKDSKVIISYFQECYQLGVEILPLDINQSQVTCSVEHGKSLRLGLSALAPGSKQFVEDIIAERQKNGPFQNFQDFCERIDLDSVPLLLGGNISVYLFVQSSTTTPQYSSSAPASNSFGASLALSTGATIFIFSSKSKI